MSTQAKSTPSEAGLTAWVDIFRSGIHADSSNTTHSFSSDNISHMIQSFSPVRDRVPLVIGHPKMDSPAYGWLAGLRQEGEVLQAQFKDVHEDIKQLVERKHYKNVSVSLYGNKTLRHVGLLGAVPPAIKGLKEVQFSESQEYASFDRTTEKNFEAELCFAQAEIDSFKARESEWEREKLAHKVEQLVLQGNILPREQEKIFNFALALHGAPTLNFSEGGQEKPLLQGFIEFLESQNHGLLTEVALPRPKKEQGAPSPEGKENKAFLL